MQDEYAVGVSDVMESPWRHGCMIAATGGQRDRNPYPTESPEWQEWLTGYQAWEDAPKVEIELLDP